MLSTTLGLKKLATFAAIATVMTVVAATAIIFQTAATVTTPARRLQKRDKDRSV